MKRKTVFIFVCVIVILFLFLPSFSRMQDLKQKNIKCLKQIGQLKAKNILLKEEKEKLLNDPVYLEKVAREKMNLIRKGEVVYRIVPEQKQE